MVLYRIDDRQQEIFVAVSRFPGIFSQELLNSFSYDKKQKIDVSQLVNYCLLKRFKSAVGDTRYTMHPIIRKFALLVTHELPEWRVTSPLYLAVSYHTKMSMLYQSYPNGDLKRMLNLSLSGEVLDVSFINKRFKEFEGKYKEAFICFNDDHHIGVTYGIFATLYYRAQDYERAIQMRTKQLKIFRSLYGDHKRTANVLEEISKVYESLKSAGSLVTAIKYMNQSYFMRKSISSQTPISTVVSLGDLLLQSGSLDDGITMLHDLLNELRSANETLDLQKTPLEAKYYLPMMSDMMFYACLMYEKLGIGKRTLDLLLEAINTRQTPGVIPHLDETPRRKEVVEQHLQTSNMAIKAARLLSREERDDRQSLNKSIQYYMIALQIQETLNGNDSINVADILFEIGFVYGRMQKYSEAVLVFNRSLSTMMTSAENSHLDIAYLSYLVGELCYMKNRYQESIKPLKISMDILLDFDSPNMDKNAQHLEQAVALLTIIYFQTGQCDNLLELLGTIAQNSAKIKLFGVVGKVIISINIVKIVVFFLAIVQFLLTTKLYIRTCQMRRKLELDLMTITSRKYYDVICFSDLETLPTSRKCYKPQLGLLLGKIVQYLKKIMMLTLTIAITISVFTPVLFLITTIMALRITQMIRELLELLNENHK
ncbi:uncharacterized protein [Amphiura filiformis]|uniref:uncharacterized protein isoform X1 n=1 Tax=Amphiura filiformis TaxID=82378 RepID=UPI003B2103A5